MFTLERLILLLFVLFVAAAPVMVKWVTRLVIRGRERAGLPPRKPRPHRSRMPVPPFSDSPENDPQRVLKRIHAMTRTEEERDKWEGRTVENTVRHSDSEAYQHLGKVEKNGGLRFVRRLTPLKQAIVWSEILSRPAADRERNSWD